MKGAVAEMWAKADETERRRLLTRALEGKCPLDCDLLGIEPDELDRVALPMGFVAVYVPRVEETGLTVPTPGVVSPAIAADYRARKVRA